jgi:hypothetical protein
VFPPKVSIPTSENGRTDLQTNEMRLGIMQPYFFPYLGYYSLIKHTDKWIIFDNVQFIRHGWIERNRILKPAEGWQYIAAPLMKHERFTTIKDVSIRNNEDWKEKIVRQIDHYKKAPYFSQTRDLLRAALAIETDSIVDLNAHILKTTCDYLSIPFEVNIFSQMNLDMDPVNHPGEWALHISKAMQAGEYINPPNGIDLFNPVQFKEANIRLTFIKNNLTPYSQRRPQFESGLSIIDVLMFNSIEQTLCLIDDIEVVRK